MSEIIRREEIETENGRRIVVLYIAIDDECPPDKSYLLDTKYTYMDGEPTREWDWI